MTGYVVTSSSTSSDASSELTARCRGFLTTVPFPAPTPSSRPSADFPASGVRDRHLGIQDAEKPSEMRFLTQLLSVPLACPGAADRWPPSGWASAQWLASWPSTAPRESRQARVTLQRLLVIIGEAGGRSPGSWSRRRSRSLALLASAVETPTQGQDHVNLRFTRYRPHKPSERDP